MDASKLPLPVLMLVTNRHLAGGDDPLLDAVSEAVEGGVNIVQLREKDLDDAALWSLASKVRDAISGRAMLLVNGRLDVAAVTNADGVHLSEIAPAVSTPIVGLLGRSVHSLEGAQRAEAEGADYVVFGPVYETASHPGVSAAGIGALAGVVRAVRIPVIAIGGITAERVSDVMSTGAAGIAVIGAVLGSPSPREAAQQLSRGLGTKVA
jgi:thiamine-phosphate pyrophosphorylase